MVDQNIILIGYAVPLLFGLALMTRLGESFSPTLTSRSPLYAFPRRRHMLGLNIVAFVGFVVSVHTLWISNKISEGGNVCSSATVFSCDDVLGNAQYNVDPIFGISWGLIGMFAFAAVLLSQMRWAKNPMPFGLNRTSSTGRS